MLASIISIGFSSFSALRVVMKECHTKERTPTKEDLDGVSSHD